MLTTGTFVPEPLWGLFFVFGRGGNPFFYPFEPAHACLAEGDRPRLSNGNGRIEVYVLNGMEQSNTLLEGLLECFAAQNKALPSGSFIDYSGSYSLR